MQAPEEALRQTAVYVRICGADILFIIPYNILAAIFRGLGDSKSPLIFVAVACAVNVGGDLVLVAGFRMDAAGAALAAVFAQAVSVMPYQGHQRHNLHSQRYLHPIPDRHLPLPRLRGLRRGAHARETLDIFTGCYAIIEENTGGTRVNVL